MPTLHDSLGIPIAVPAEFQVDLASLRRKISCSRDMNSQWRSHDNHDEDSYTSDLVTCELLLTKPWRIRNIAITPLGGFRWSHACTYYLSLSFS